MPLCLCLAHYYMCFLLVGLLFTMYEKCTSSSPSLLVVFTQRSLPACVKPVLMEDPNADFGPTPLSVCSLPDPTVPLQQPHPIHQSKFQVGVNLLGNKYNSDSDSDHPAQ